MKNQKFLFNLAIILVFIYFFLVIYIFPRPYWITEFDADQLYFANIYSKLKFNEYFSLLHPGIILSKLYYFLYLLNNDLNLTASTIQVLLKFLILFIVIFFFYTISKFKFLNLSQKALLIFLFISNPFFFNLLDYSNSEQFIYVLSFVFFFKNYELLEKKLFKLNNIFILSIVSISMVGLKFSSLPIVVVSIFLNFINLYLYKKHKELAFLTLFILSSIIIFFYGIIEYIPFIVAKTFLGQLNNNIDTSHAYNFQTLIIYIILLSLSFFSLYKIYVKFRKKKFKNIQFELFSGISILFFLYFFLTSNFYIPDFKSSLNFISDRLRNISVYYVIFIFYLVKSINLVKLKYLFSILFLIFIFSIKFFNDRISFINNFNKTDLFISSFYNEKCNKCTIYVDDYLKIKEAYFFHANTFVKNIFWKELDQKSQYKFLNLRRIFYDYEFLKILKQNNITPNYLGALSPEIKSKLAKEKLFSETKIVSKNIYKDIFCEYFSCLNYEVKYHSSGFKKNDYLIYSQHHIKGLLNRSVDNRIFMHLMNEYFQNKFKQKLEVVKSHKIESVHSDVLYIIKIN